MSTQCMQTYHCISSVQYDTAVNRCNDAFPSLLASNKYSLALSSIHNNMKCCPKKKRSYFNAKTIPMEAKGKSMNEPKKEGKTNQRI